MKPAYVLDGMVDEYVKRVAALGLPPNRSSRRLALRRSTSSNTSSRHRDGPGRFPQDCGRSDGRWGVSSWRSRSCDRQRRPADPPGPGGGAYEIVSFLGAIVTAGASDSPRNARTTSSWTSSPTGSPSREAGTRPVSYAIMFVLFSIVLVADLRVRDEAARDGELSETLRIATTRSCSGLPGIASSR